MYFLTFFNDKIKVDISEITIIIVFLIKFSLKVILKLNSSGNREIWENICWLNFFNQSINAKAIVCGAGRWEQT